ncbi:hypothetical protein HII36_26810 [Nonomuraea sp. NN258]|uniref:hypothetical protein n=1 Tax=Nonomuraea antri TaxID=2730852 RepID=UPI0015691AEC|nr:hypothetical protein [Nonomuraea antri]NRQ35413.1 hypothetical protein [Nonomuraea antri]
MRRTLVILDAGPTPSAGRPSGERRGSRERFRYRCVFSPASTRDDEGAVLRAGRPCHDSRKGFQIYRAQ